MAYRCLGPICLTSVVDSGPRWARVAFNPCLVSILLGFVPVTIHSHIFNNLIILLCAHKN